ncbi:MAG: hypothetical protein WB493_00085 [Anaeromyxobacteraceae bacterium]
MRPTSIGPAFAAAIAILASACAGPSAEAGKRPGPRGEIVFYVDDYAYRAAAFDDQEIGAGKMGGPSYSSLKLTPSGTWKGQVASFCSGGDPTDFTFKREYVGNPTYRSALVELQVEGSRITGMGTDVTFARIDGGFRITGIWMKDNVDLTVTRASARAQRVAFTSKGSGRFEAPTVPPLFVQLTGEAANLEDAPFPQVALTALAIGWGVHPYP